MSGIQWRTTAEILAGSGFFMIDLRVSQFVKAVRNVHSFLQEESLNNQSILRHTTLLYLGCAEAHSDESLRNLRTEIHHVRDYFVLPNCGIIYVIRHTRDGNKWEIILKYRIR